MLMHVTNECERRADEVIDFLAGPRLFIPRADYPDFDAWAQRAHGQLKAQSKRAMVALERCAVIGVVLYQRHKTLAGTLEVKNVTVRPDRRGRYLASFLLRNAELEGAREFGCARVVADAKARNAAIRLFLLQHRYRVLASEDLYRLSAGEDVVYAKEMAGGHG
jgi:ribosomal protein S18 acetylase RimI-like enzyme